PLMATLSGVGLAANVVLSPTSIDFSNSTVQMVTLSNTGNATLTITGFTSDDTKHFTVANETCGSTLEAGGACTFSVTFLPDPGTWQATITVEADGRGQHTLVVSASRIG
ncbi:MAG TPA: choice-of-anchor D domain-containing protein, partial [Gaiellaceae bacterium]|nr:choice-of-anchor D domain-containing protein [Gaiellaceae bacterium]